MTNRRLHEYQINLSISRDELLKYYRGSARQVVARASSGQNISFPVDSLKPYVTHYGVSGSFIVRVTNDNKLVDVKPAN